jgi:glycosyltransferase involved in cell wall biosynthesis
VISAGPVGATMSGPAIRAVEFARALSPCGEVTLAAAAPEGSVEPDRSIPHVMFRQQDPRPLRRHVARADVIVSQPPWPIVAAWARRSGALLLYDLYDPEPLEMLAGGAGATALEPGRITGLWLTLMRDRVLSALRDGHRFVCASEKQRDLWVGAMMAERLVTPAVYRRDPSLRSLIDVAPFGVPPDPPKPTGRHPIRQRFPEIGPDDDVVLWNGGIWNWLDAPTAVRAVGRLAERRPTVRLVFMGVTDDASARAAIAAAREAAEQSGVLGKNVLFNDRWVPYDDRGGWLLEADCAVSTHLDHLETRFAFRTRLLDCFWAGLPIVCTAGDELAARVEREALGVAVPQRDVDALADGLNRVLERGRASYAEALAKAAADHAWPRVTEPVIRLATAPGPTRRLAAPGLPPMARTVRELAYRAGRSGLNAVGATTWPRP